MVGGQTLFAHLTMRQFFKILILAILLFFFGGLTTYSWAESNCDSIPSDQSDQKARCLQDLIKEYEGKISDLRGKQLTLANTIAVLNNQIILTQAKISATEQDIAQLETEIKDLSGKIGQLNDVLTDVSQLLSLRIGETYKRMLVSPVYYLFSANGFSEFLSRVEYLRSVQYHDRELLFQMEEARLNFDKQKSLKEQKQKELEVLQRQLSEQKQLLDQQKGSKQELLRVTRNDEQTFQGLLAKTRAEFEAIQSILAGKGQETKVGDAKEGESIASIISGNSACSTGTHLHFQVAKGGTNDNPANYLKSVDVIWSLSGWYGNDDPFGFSGSWSWPVNDTPMITQGYGMTAYARSGAYGGAPHTGIDIVPWNKSANTVGDLTVKTTKDGILYRGSIACGGGTLRYVKVEHKDSDISTYYLHINYVK